MGERTDGSSVNDGGEKSDSDDVQLDHGEGCRWRFNWEVDDLQSNPPSLLYLFSPLL